jgi:hypothetical protein
MTQLADNTQAYLYLSAITEIRGKPIEMNAYFSGLVIILYHIICHHNHFL